MTDEKFLEEVMHRWAWMVTDKEDVPKLVDMVRSLTEKINSRKNLAQGRNIIVIEVLGGTIMQYELDDIAETWVHFGMPRGEYTLHEKEIERLTSEIRDVVARYGK